MENFTNVTNSTDHCLIAQSVAAQLELKVVFTLESIFGVLALFPSMLTLYLLWRVKIFHANLRLILANLTGNLFVYSASEAIKVIHRLTSDPCTSHNMPLKTCMLRDYFVIVPAHNALISLVILNLERLYATFRYRTYDYGSHVPYLGLVLLAAAWATTLGLNIPGYFAAPETARVAVCELALVGQPDAVFNVIILMASFETVAAVITFFVYVYNKYILGRMSLNRARYDLSARFQVSQNEQLNTALMPGMLLHMVCHLPTYIFLTVLFVLKGQLATETKTWLLHLTYLWRLIYALLDPILLITLNASLRQGLKKTAIGRLLIAACKCCGKRNKTKTQDTATKSVTVMNAHFDYLQQSWAMQKPPTSSDGK